MISWHKLLLAFAAVAGVATAQAPAKKPLRPTAHMRFLSFVIRDHGPTADESRSFARGEVELASLVQNWLASPEHNKRVERHFSDLFGVRFNTHVTQDHLVLKKNDDDAYNLGTKPACSVDNAVDTGAWFLEGDETIKVCPASISSDIKFGEADKEHRCTAGWWEMSDARCGCGPNMIACIPDYLVEDLRQAIRSEAGWRGVNAYDQDSSWKDLFAGDYFYGSRLLYWQYLVSGQLVPYATIPAAGTLKEMAALPLFEPARAAFPTDGAERAGLVTSPGFLNQVNDFRLRTRALTERLLCQSVGPTLNTDGIAEFLNPSFSELDRAHGSKTDCAGCHYYMDNAGSTLFGWNAQGYFNPGDPAVSQLGHVFSEQGSGPAFLARSYVERGPGFTECMAKRAWQAFSGLSWASLTKDAQQRIVEASEAGPRSLILGVLSSPELEELGAEPEAPAPAAVTVGYDEVQPILAQMCVGCHSPGASLTNYVDDPQTLLARKDSVAARITTKGSGQMPPPSSGRMMTDDQIDLILKHLGKR